MTIASTARKAGPFTGNGIQSAWPFTFKVFAPADVRATLADGNGAETVLVPDADYTVTLNSNQETSPGGTVNYLLAGGSRLVITSKVSYDQPLDLPSGGNYNPQALENQLDRTVMQIQQLNEELGRAAKVPVTYDAADLEEFTADIVRLADSADNIDTVAQNIATVDAVAADIAVVAENVADVTNFADVYYGPSATDPATRRDGSALQGGDLYFNTSAQRMRVYAEGAWWDGVTNTTTTSVQRFSGDGSTVTFALVVDPVSENNTQVFIGGMYQQKDTYAVSGTILTFNVAPPAGAGNIEVVSTGTVAGFGTLPASAVTFVPPTPGAVSTTAQAKLAQVVGVIDTGDTDNIGVLVLAVPSQYATIQAAFDYLAGKTIAAGTTVQIKVADGAYTLSSSINANHPQGSQIQLIGNESLPDNCVITVSGAPTFDALVVSNGHSLGYLNGFRFNLASKAGAANNYTAVLANNGATIVCGPKIKTNNWYYGIAARNGSFISCDYAEVDNAGDVGIWAFVGSTVYCRYATSTNASDAANPWGFGFQAEYGSAMDCSNATASGCKVAGIASLSNSNVRAIAATSNSNTGSGFLARDNGTIENHNSTTNSNARYGEERLGGGIIFGSGTTLSGNTIAAFNGYSYFDNSEALGARIAANGPLRIDNNGTDPTFFNTEGGVQAEIFHTESSNSWVQLSGSSSNAPRVQAGGAAADIDLQLLPKGTGKLRWGVHSAGTVTPNGYIEWKLADGATVRVAAQRL